MAAVPSLQQNKVSVDALIDFIESLDVEKSQSRHSKDFDEEFYPISKNIFNDSDYKLEVLPEVEFVDLGDDEIITELAIQSDFSVNVVSYKKIHNNDHSSQQSFLSNDVPSFPEPEVFQGINSESSIDIPLKNHKSRNIPGGPTLEISPKTSPKIDTWPQEFPSKRDLNSSPSNSNLRPMAHFKRRSPAFSKPIVTRTSTTDEYTRFAAANGGGTGFLMDRTDRQQLPDTSSSSSPPVRPRPRVNTSSGLFTSALKGLGGATTPSSNRGATQPTRSPRSDRR